MSISLVRLVDRDAANGCVRWQLKLPSTPAATLPVVVSGSLVVQAILAYQLSDGRPLWRATAPEFVQTPAVPTSGGFIIRAASLGHGCPLDSSW